MKMADGPAVHFVRTYCDRMSYVNAFIAPRGQPSFFLLCAAVAFSLQVPAIRKVHLPTRGPIADEGDECGPENSRLRL